MKLPELFQHPLFAPSVIQIILATQWLQGSWEKFQGGSFVASMTKTLVRFENGNPHTWYVGSFLQTAKAHPDVFGQLVQWGELLAGLGLVAGILLTLSGKTPTIKRNAMLLSVAALIGGAFMNANFYFAAGWMSASTGGLNALMFWIELALLIGWLSLYLKKGLKNG